jgi:hypothetical protein
MTKGKIKVYLDFIPFIILFISACILIWTIAITNFVLTWRNIVGIVVLPLNVLFFIRQHQFGALFLGLILFLGLFGLLSFTPGLTSATVTFGLNDSRIEFWGQPIFVLWMVIHFILSGRYYVGIVSNKYWQEIRDKQKR